MSFHDDLEATLKIYESLIGGFAHRTRDMIDRLGEIEALSRLVTSADLQQGFKILRDRQRLDVTFEAIVTKHAEKFKSSTVEAAQWRLDNAAKLE